MSPNLVLCMFFSLIVAAIAATFAVVTGWGLLIGFLVYSLGGSVALVISAAVGAFWMERREAAAQGRSGSEPRRAVASRSLPVRAHTG